MRILALCGSLQAKSGNLALLKTAAAAMPPGVDLVLFKGLRDLPYFNPDIEASGVPESVTQWRLALTASDAVLIACPEYGFSLPGVLKNSIEWVIGSGELEQKVVAITAAVAGPERGRRGLQALRDSLSAVRVTIVGGEPITKGPGFETQVAALVRALVEATASSRDHHLTGEKRRHVALLVDEVLREVPGRQIPGLTKERVDRRLAGLVLRHDLVEHRERHVVGELAELGCRCGRTRLRLVKPRRILADVDNSTSLNGAKMSTFSSSPCIDPEAI